MFLLHAKEQDMATMEMEKPRLMKATPALARKFRDMERFPRDRDLNLRRLEFVKTTMRSGEFRGSEWVSALNRDDGKIYRLNGRHTSTAMCDLFEEGVSIDANMLVREYACDTLEDMARLWSTFDPAQSARRKPDILRSFAGAEPALSEVSSRTLSLATAGLAFNLWEVESSRKPVVDQAMLLLQNVEFARWFADIVHDQSSCSHMRRIAVAAAMARTYFKNKAAATEFWLKIRDDCDDPVRSGSRVLYRWLLKHSLGGEKGRGKENASSREMFVRCLLGYNAWRKGEDTKLQYLPKAKTPAAA
jgi:hypothetical protein